ncbi:MAG: hypothetical protein AB7I48_15270 [Planctomycetaceae bacterium]
MHMTLQMRFQLASIPVLLVVGLKATLGCRSVQAQGQLTLDQVISQMRAFDEVYTSGLTARGWEVETPVPLGVEAFGTKSANPQQGKRQQPRKSLVSFTIANSKQAVMNEYQFQPEAIGRSGDSGPTLAVRRKALFVIDGDWTAKRTLASANGTDEGQVFVTTHTTQERGDLIWFQQRVLWALGRGYANYLKPPGTVAMNGAEIEIECSGSFLGPEEYGDWSLTVDPSLGYLVTRARYVGVDNAGRILNVRMSDPKIDGDCVFPSLSSMDRGPLLAFEYEFTDAELAFDNELFEVTLAEIEMEAPKGSTVIDRRVGSPPLVSVVGAKERVPAALLPPTEQVKRIRLWLILGNIVLLAGVVAWILVRRRRTA